MIVDTKNKHVSSMLGGSNNKHFFPGDAGWKFGTKVSTGQILIGALAGFKQPSSNCVLMR